MKMPNDDNEEIMNKNDKEPKVLYHNKDLEQVRYHVVLINRNNEKTLLTGLVEWQQAINTLRTFERAVMNKDFINISDPEKIVGYVKSMRSIDIKEIHVVPEQKLPIQHKGE